MEDIAKLPPIWEVPAVKEKVQRVNQYITCMLRAKNLFGWRTFIDDLKVDMEGEIYKHDELYRQGVHKEYGVGAYCRMALQGALNYKDKCMAQCRRINYETTSLDQLTETEKGHVSMQVPARDDQEVQKLDLLVSIQLEFGDRIKELAQIILDGGTLSKDELKELKKEAKNQAMRDLLVES